MIAGIWLALGVAAIAASAIGYTRQGDARSIIRFSASLALVQIVDPMGGLIVAALLPGLFGLRRKEAAQSAGLYALVLFMPAIAAVTLAYLAHFRHIDVARILRGLLPPAGPDAIVSAPQHVLASIVPLAMAVPALLRGVMDERGWKPPNVVIVLIAGAMCAAAIVSALTGTARPASALMVGALPLPLIAMWQWPASRTRLRDGAIVSGLTGLLAWSLA